MAFAVSVPVLAAAEDTGFDDVTADAWYAEAVVYCNDNGLMRGTSVTEFSPNAEMSRAMLAAVLYRAEGSPAADGTNPFTDVVNGAWYASAVNWAAETGIISGYGNGVFGTNDSITREQIAAILWRYDGNPIADGNSARFADSAQISPWAANAANWARDNSIINGKPGNLFDPKAGATRAEVATILRNYFSAKQETPATAPEAASEAAPEPTSASAADDEGKILIAYFSNTGNTENVANHLNSILDADLYEITPDTPYTSADLNYSDASSRSAKEQNDPSARPSISGSVDNMDEYNVVFIGYPIWWGQAPKIIGTFLESYDFSDKTIIPFCTSGSSGIGSSADNLHSLTSDAAAWLSGTRFGSGATLSAVETWVNGLGLELAAGP
jgi:flavodoxin